jgi:hypothetical protein
MAARTAASLSSVGVSWHFTMNIRIESTSMRKSRSFRYRSCGVIMIHQLGNCSPCDFASGSQPARIHRLSHSLLRHPRVICPGLPSSLFRPRYELFIRFIFILFTVAFAARHPRAQSSMLAAFMTAVAEFGTLRWIAPVRTKRAGVVFGMAFVIIFNFCHLPSAPSTPEHAPHGTDCHTTEAWTRWTHR